ncbi:ribonuclease pancreatic-like [Protobothrops mucrosquamatus]|uniref:ribonuclease pancreatic-like n=1 Tax=Protobothrops mucrosquamatus TaxID=103944 RepID=UPI000775C94B|nr:ribonuclease pancreatic-like [Protobothrops mucrosquamatus]
MTVSRLLLQLLVLLGVLLVHYGEARTYRRFARRHIDHPKTGANNLDAYCNKMMRRRRMTRPRCKLSNTFIHAPPNSIIAVCGSGGTHFRDKLYDSWSSFPMTLCSNTGRFPRCKYNGRTLNQRVRLKCERGKPVHFESLL